METDEQARNRFQAELEFVQCLANPNYLNFEVRDSCDTYGNSLATTEKGPVHKSWDFMDYYHTKYVPSLLWQHFYLLAQRGYLRERPFINYLKYLLYWKEPDYAKFLKYPHCLHMLELLQYEHFRKELVNAQCAKFIDEQQLLHWQHYSRKRTRLQQALAEQQQQQAPPHGNAVTK